MCNLRWHLTSCSYVIGNFYCNSLGYWGEGYAIMWFTYVQKGCLFHSLWWLKTHKLTVFFDFHSWWSNPLVCMGLQSRIMFPLVFVLFWQYSSLLCNLYSFYSISDIPYASRDIFFFFDIRVQWLELTNFKRGEVKYLKWFFTYCFSAS